MRLGSAQQECFSIGVEEGREREGGETSQLSVRLGSAQQECCRMEGEERERETSHLSVRLRREGGREGRPVISV